MYLTELQLQGSVVRRLKRCQRASTCERQYACDTPLYPWEAPMCPWHTMQMCPWHTTPSLWHTPSCLRDANVPTTHNANTPMTHTVWHAKAMCSWETPTCPQHTMQTCPRHTPTCLWQRQCARDTQGQRARGRCHLAHDTQGQHAHERRQRAHETHKANMLMTHKAHIPMRDINVPMTHKANTPTRDANMLMTHANMPMRDANVSMTHDASVPPCLHTCYGLQCIDISIVFHVKDPLDGCLNWIQHLAFILNNALRLIRRWCPAELCLMPGDWHNLPAGHARVAVHWAGLRARRGRSRAAGSSEVEVQTNSLAPGGGATRHHGRRRKWRYEGAPEAESGPFNPCRCSLCVCSCTRSGGGHGSGRAGSGRRWRWRRGGPGGAAGLDPHSLPLRHGQERLPPVSAPVAPRGAGGRPGGAARGAWFSGGRRPLARGTRPAQRQRGVCFLSCPPGTSSWTWGFSLRASGSPGTWRTSTWCLRRPWRSGGGEWLVLGKTRCPLTRVHWGDRGLGGKQQAREALGADRDCCTWSAGRSPSWCSSPEQPPAWTQPCWQKVGSRGLANPTQAGRWAVLAETSRLLVRAPSLPGVCNADRCSQQLHFGKLMSDFWYITLVH